ncbi:hypothetical protein GCM10009639_02340 [Kitasatospora putterlickiae]|uniref:SH3b domain-containing protein n=1 Tax=Kitasatospora putterlickiae TaxID=221725 RepID=A0ABN1XJ03_9ACTN
MRIPRLREALLAGAVTASLAITATPASATADTATTTTAATTTTDTITTAPLTQPSWCGWQPANNSNMFAVVSWDFVNVRSGQGTECDVVGSATRWNTVRARCYIDNGIGERWYYSDVNGVRGWIFGGALTGLAEPARC